MNYLPSELLGVISSFCSEGTLLYLMYTSKEFSKYAWKYYRKVWFHSISITVKVEPLNMNLEKGHFIYIIQPMITYPSGSIMPSGVKLNCTKCGANSWKYCGRKNPKHWMCLPRIN